MNNRIVPNLNHLLDDFFERVGLNVAAKTEECLEITFSLGKESDLANLVEEITRSIFYELFELERAEDASEGTNDVIARGLGGIQRTVDEAARYLRERGSVVSHRRISVLDDAEGGRKDEY